MRVVIWVDMEGIAGIENWDQVSSGKPQYEEGRRLLTGEVNAAAWRESRWRRWHHCDRLSWRGWLR